MEKIIKGVSLKIVPAKFEKSNGEVANYFNCELLLESGAPIRVKLETTTANLLFNGFLK